MPDMSFNDFLGKISGETQDKPRRRLREDSEPEAKKERKPEPEMKKEKKPEPEKRKEVSKTNKNDDIVVKAMDYSTRFMKVIYENFSDEKDRRVVLHSIRSAIDFALGDYSQPVQNSEPRVEKKQLVAQETTNENIEIKMNDLSGQEVSIQQQPPIDEENIYKQELNLGLKVGNDGKQEVDLSRVSQKDIYEMRVLAGVDPNQKKREEKSQTLNESQIAEIENGER